MKYAPFAANTAFVDAARGRRFIREGHVGSHVQLLQGALIDLGYRMPKTVRANGYPDARFGPETIRVVASFQERNGLKVDGIAGPKTLNKLDALMVKKSKVPSSTFNMFPAPYSPEYALGSGDPPVRRDPGAGTWKSESSTMVAAVQLKAIQAILLPARFAIGDDAVKHLEHYFGNTGTPLTIDLEAMVRDVPSARAVYRVEVAQAKSFVEKLAPGRYAITSRRTNSGYNRQTESKNWYFAIGGYSVWGKGNAEVLSGPLDRITLELRYCFFDRYNWDNGKSVTIQGIKITDHFMGAFHRQGLAQEFDAVGSFTRRFQWRRSEPIPNDQY